MLNLKRWSRTARRFRLRGSWFTESSYCAVHFSALNHYYLHGGALPAHPYNSTISWNCNMDKNIDKKELDTLLRYHSQLSQVIGRYGPMIDTFIDVTNEINKKLGIPPVPKDARQIADRLATLPRAEADRLMDEAYRNKKAGQ